MMGGATAELTDSGSLYSTGVGVIYVFNLIVGTGALTMPAAFQSAGWLISLITVIVLAFVSFITVTFMVEAMAIANAKLRLKVLDRSETSSVDGVQGMVSEITPILQAKPEVSEFEITLRVEMGKMASMFFNRVGIFLFNLCIIVYLFGDLSIYAVAVPKSLRDVVCTYDGGNNTNNTGNTSDMTIGDSDPCWGGVDLTRENTYRVFVVGLTLLVFVETFSLILPFCRVRMQSSHSLFTLPNIYVFIATPEHVHQSNQKWWFQCTLLYIVLYDYCWAFCMMFFQAAFFLLLGPFVFFNVQKTKYLQILTTAARWIAFGLMIVLATIQLAEGKGQGHPVVGDISGVPNLFGVCVYSFMCHHSLPSLVTPIRDKSRLTAVLAGDYTLILIFYAILSFTGIFTFSSIEDLYTLNFQPNEHGHQVVTNVKFIEYFLALFPVFTLSTNFPIIAITLRNNLQAVLARPSFPSWVNRILIGLLAVVPPTIVAVITNKVDFLVGITGSYAGAGIQYVIPAVLVLLARRQVLDLEARLGGPQIHRSPFSSPVWVYLVLGWAALCVIFVTINHIVTGK